VTDVETQCLAQHVEKPGSFTNKPKPSLYIPTEQVSCSTHQHFYLRCSIG